MSSNLGKWKHHAAATGVGFYGDHDTYRIGEEWLSGLAVEDWGCGMGGFSAYHEGPYRGVDGSPAKMVDEVVDLCEYRSDAEAIYMRHVLEHNDDWQKILHNAVASFRKRMVLVLFTPLVEETRVLVRHKTIDCPDIAFSRKDLLAEFAPYLVSETTIPVDRGYKVEHLFFLEKPE